MPDTPFFLLTRGRLHRSVRTVQLDLGATRSSSQSLRAEARPSILGSPPPYRTVPAAGRSHDTVRLAPAPRAPSPGDCQPETQQMTVIVDLSHGPPPYPSASVFQPGRHESPPSPRPVLGTVCQSLRGSTSQLGKDGAVSAKLRPYRLPQDLKQPDK
eukprot:766331-Hanusia_phi.AAC.6